MRVLLVLVLAACGPKHPNQCPDNLTGHCVGGEVCTFDQRRGCQSCECRAIDQAPNGTDPDQKSHDPSAPQDPTRQPM